MDWLLRTQDDFRADKRKALGTEMVRLGYELGNLRNPAQARPQIDDMRLSLLVSWGYGCQISEYLILSPVVPTA